MTKEQLDAIWNLYQRDTSVAESFQAFFAQAWTQFGGVWFVTWKGMTIGVEKDGYTHS